MKNREIKFRFWNIYSKTMWMNIHELYDGYGNIFCNKCSNFKECNHDHDFGGSSFGDILENIEESIEEGDPCGSVMQYTGLKDRNGVDVYEGDILTKEYDGIEPMKEEEIKDIPKGVALPAAIVYGLEAGTEKIVVEIPEIYHENIHDFEISGNVYENPELLED